MTMVVLDALFLQTTMYVVVAAGVGVGTVGDRSVEVHLRAIVDVIILVIGIMNAVIVTEGHGATVAAGLEATAVVATEETGIGGTGTETGTEKVGAVVAEAGVPAGDLLATVAVGVEA